MGVYCDGCGTRGCRNCDGPYRTSARPASPAGWWRQRRVDLVFVLVSQVLFFCLGWSLAPKTRTVTRVERVEHCATPLSRDERACQRLCEHGQRTVLKFKSGVHDYTCECY